VGNNSGAFEHNRKGKDGFGPEYWYARDISEILGYPEYKAFVEELKLAVEGCKACSINPRQHFVATKRLKEIEGIKYNVSDYMLSRFACFLTVKDDETFSNMMGFGNACFTEAAEAKEPPLGKENEEKKLLQLGQTSEALKEIEDRKRLLLRPQLAACNTALSTLAGNSGIWGPGGFKEFYDEGCKGLYDGRTVADVREIKGVSAKGDVFEKVGSKELLLNLMKTKLTMRNIVSTSGFREPGADGVVEIHHNAGHYVRWANNEVRGTRPELLPVPDLSFTRLTTKYKRNEPVQLGLQTGAEEGKNE